MLIKIEEGIAIPEKRNCTGTSELRSAIEMLQSGQSFALPLKRESYLRTLTYVIKKRMNDGRAYMVRKVSSTECRVWRTA